MRGPKCYGYSGGGIVAVASEFTTPVHGGPDDGPPIRIDFSTNAHPLGPNPYVRDVIERADRSRYPDPGYARLRHALGAFHGVEAERVVVGGSASELIWRITRCWSETDEASVAAHERTFGEYLRAAQALDVMVAGECPVGARTAPMLYWCCNPDNPTGASLDERIESLIGERPRSDGTRDVIVADLAYEPFRTLLEEDAAAPGMKPPTWLDHVLQLWSPNKLHGLTGVRGAYLILPMAAPPSMEVATLKRLAPSWVLGADGVALLEAHTRPEAAAFLLETAPTLRSWKRQQERMLVDAGWQAQASPLHYGLWKPPIDPTDFPRWIAMLRVHAIKVRDARSFGRPGWVRLVCREPEEVQELVHLTDSLRNRR